MPKFGDYASGGVGQATDTLLIKRGTTTVRTTLDQLPVSAEVAGQLAEKTNNTQFLNDIQDLQTQLNTGLASKDNVLTFTGKLVRTGNTVALEPFDSAGSILDGRSTYCILTGTTSWGTFPAVNVGANVVGTTSHQSTNNPSNLWQDRGRGRITSAAAINSHSRLYYVPPVRFPQTGSATTGGFRFAATYCTVDAVQGASFVGVVQNLPAGGTQPSAYSGTRVGFCHDKGGTEWLFRVGGSTVSLGANFPADGNATNPYLFEFTSTPAPNWKITWRARHLLTGAEVSGENTAASASLSGSFAHNFMMIRDTIDGTTAVAFESTGMATGAFIEYTQGEPAAVTGNTITANQTITRLPYANAENAVNSATPVTLTIANSGFTDRDYFYGTNLGVGAVTIAGDGFTIEKDDNVPATVGQYQSFSLQYINGIWVRLS